LPHKLGHFSLQYVTFTSCNVIVLRRSHQQSLVAKWLGLGVTVRATVRARAREWDYFFFFKVTKTFVLLSYTLTVRCSRCKDNSTWRNDDACIL